MNRKRRGLYITATASDKIAATMNPSDRSELLNLLARESYFERELKLTSGRGSNYYIDCKRTLYLPLGAHLAGEAVLEIVKAAGVAQLGGMAAGALPVTDAVIAAAYRNRVELRGFFVRKETKAHGLQQLIEGAFQKGLKTAVIDDTITTGGSSLQAVAAMREAGANVTHAIAMVERGEGAADAFASAGLEYRWVFTAEEIRAAAKTQK
ncbi:MAG TPA: orotate phosphoribosyltransferase [Candidatus Binataceae bacterium]|nr:orotate phosphoribosyltransferase [Candidatus Binataceae bacterium]